MVPNSPAEALGSHSPGVHDLVIEVVQARHERAVEAHEAAATRYAMGFGSQWRDLLDDTRDAFKDRGYPSRKLAPGGYRIPIVNDCLVYVWRVPSAPDAVSDFASSTTRMNGFSASPPEPALFDNSFVDGGAPTLDGVAGLEVQRLVTLLGGEMPVVLVMVRSSPRHLGSIEWAVAEFAAGKVRLHGEETIWEPELSMDEAVADIESFDSGTPVAPAVELQEQDRPSDA
ncbi:hypothetical protein JF66_13160 [Cryobacterium sp. MLB-32]|nr:hypothetical protein JF66_13160 [Cryobacterium sp. MLB-32]